MKIELGGHYGYRRLIVSSLPGMAMMIIGSLYSIVDGLFVSNCVGITPFAGLNLVWPAIMVVGALGLMIGSGGSAIVSRMLGQGNMDRACRTFTSLVAFCILLAVFFGALMFLLMPRIVLLLGATGDELIRNAVLYGRVFAVGMPAFMLQTAFQPFFMVAEKPELGTAVSLACGVTNMVLDATFMVVFKMGLFGAALASILACCVGGLFPLWYFLRRREEGRLRLTSVKFERPVLMEACTNGSSEYVGNIAFSLVSMCYNLQLMRLYGEGGVAAYSVIMYIGYVFVAMFSGYNLTVAPVAAYNYGAGKRDELHSLLCKSLRLLFALGVLLALLAEVLAAPAARLFVGYDPGMFALTVHAERIYMLSFVLTGVTLFTSAWFTGLGNGVVSAALAFTRSIVFEMGCVFLMPAIFGPDGIWYSVIVAEAGNLVLCAVMLARFRPRYGY